MSSLLGRLFYKTRLLAAKVNAYIGKAKTGTRECSTEIEQRQRKSLDGIIFNVEMEK